MQAQAAALAAQIGRRPDVLLAVGVLGALLVMMLPVPSWLMDVLLAANITLGVLILLTSIYILRPLEFSVFPSLLLFTTLFRLALNVASTRLILLHGQEGPAAAGHVIEGFGRFVVGGNVVVGLVVFLILVLINFVVITKGSTRVAEVAARFTLDAMPGKQMAIDADLNAGLIDDKEARRRREQVAREAEFYGAMDGAAKFVRGDAIAGLVITAINLLGGLVIGVFQHGMPVSEAAHVFSVLTVGDGLVSQIPALVISTAAGIVITRASGERALPFEIASQLAAHPRAHLVASGALLLMSLTPGLPFLPFLLLAAALGLLGWKLRLDALARAQAQAAPEPPPAPAEPEATPEAEMEEALTVDPLRVEIGYGLIEIAEAAGGLLERFQTLRRRIAQEVGYVLPPVHIKDNLRLGAGEYRILVRGAEVARAEVRPGRLLALEGPEKAALEGQPTREPAFGLPAVWIAPEKRAEAEAAGCTVVDPATVIVTHAAEVLRRHAHEMLDRAQVQAMLDKLAERHGKVVEDLVPGQVPLGVVQRVLQRLLAEWVPIRDLLRIVETVADHYTPQASVDELVEEVRRRLGRAIVQRHLGDDGVLRALLLAPTVEREIAEHGRRHGAAPLPLERWRALVDALQQAAARANLEEPVLVVAPEIRPLLAAALARALPRVSVLSAAEIPPGVPVETLAMVEPDDAH